MMILKIEKETRLELLYKIVFDYDNPYDQKLHSLMLGAEAMLNSAPAYSTTKVEVQRYDAHLPEFIPGCYAQYIKFEKIWTPRNGIYIKISIRDPETLYPIDGMVSPIDYVEQCKCRVLTRLIFDESDFIKFPYRSDEHAFKELRNWIYGHFGFNARTKIWGHFEQQVAEELQQKYPQRKDFEKYAGESALRRLQDDNVSTKCIEYYNDMLQFLFKTFTKNIDKYYKGE